jgi:hypothetical protein
MLDCVVTITIPLAVSCLAVPALTRFRFFRSLSVLEKLVVTLTAGTAFLIGMLSLWGMLLPGGFRAFSVAVYVVALGLSLWGAWENRRPRMDQARVMWGSRDRRQSITLRARPVWTAARGRAPVYQTQTGIAGEVRCIYNSLCWPTSTDGRNTPATRSS